MTLLKLGKNYLFGIDGSRFIINIVSEVLVRIK